MGKPKNLSLTWVQVNDMAIALSKKLGAGPWKGVIAVTRGGMFPALVIARRLEVLHIETFCVSSYDDQSKKRMNIIKKPVITGGGDGWLVIDDLVDSGDTFNIIRKELPRAHYATLYASARGQGQVDTFVSPVSDDMWIHFPWEDNEESYIAP